MNKKVFSTIAAVTVGTIAASGLLMKPTAAFAGEGHEQAAESKSCSGSKAAAEGDEAHKDGESKCSGDKAKKAETDGEMSCSAGSCSGTK